MKPAENNIEEQIKNLRTQASAELDAKLHRKFQAALGKEEAEHQPIRWSAILQSRIIKVAAAAIVLVSAVFWFSVSRTDEPEQPGTSRPTVAARFETPAELVSVMSLNRAFREGGLKAVEKQYEEAEKRVKSGLKEIITADELMRELQEY